MTNEQLEVIAAAVADQAADEKWNELHDEKVPTEALAHWQGRLDAALSDCIAAKNRLRAALAKMREAKP